MIPIFRLKQTAPRIIQKLKLFPKMKSTKRLGNIGSNRVSSPRQLLANHIPRKLIPPANLLPNLIRHFLRTLQNPQILKRSAHLTPLITNHQLPITNYQLPLLHPLQNPHQLLIPAGRGLPVDVNHRGFLGNQAGGEGFDADVDGGQRLVNGR